MDCNCRCCLLQIPRWAIDHKFTKIDNEKTFNKNGEINLVEGKDYNEYKKNYFSYLNNREKDDIVYDNSNSDFAKKFGNNYAVFKEFVNSSDNKELSKIWERYESEIRIGDISYKGTEHCSGSTIYINFNNNIKGDPISTPFQTIFHEAGHAIDNLLSKDIKNSLITSLHYSAKYKNGLFPQTIKNEVNELVKNKDNELKKLFKEHKDDTQWFRDNGFISDFLWDMYKKGIYNEKYIIPKYSKSYAYSEIQKEIKKIPLIARGDLSDILEGATNGKLCCGVGHGKNYWKDRTINGVDWGLGTEAFAEITSATFSNQESLKSIQKYLPKSYKLYKEMLKEL